MKTLLLFLTLAVIAFCLDTRTQHFHPVVIHARVGGALKGDLRAWPEQVILLIVLLIFCLVVTPFFTKKNNR